MTERKGEYEPLQQEKFNIDDPPERVYKKPAYIGATIAVVILIALGACSYSLFRPVMEKPGVKQGAGLLLVHEDKVLLLRRNSKNNNNTWGLPGGNFEEPDYDLLDTATREAAEEMGPLPEFEVLREIKTKRGKHQHKHFSVFVSKLQATFEPTLNAEHSAFQWVETTSVTHMEHLHPVVKVLFQKPYVQKLAAAVSMAPEALAPKKQPKKLGAGFLFVCGDEALLLTRNSTHNNATLSVPGGNVDLGEKNLVATAEREAEEELGSCPEYTYKGEIDTWRGKNNQKEFKIFLGAILAETKASFSPTLDHESLAWGWYPLDKLKDQELHPVVHILVKSHLKEVKDAFGLP